MALEITFGVDCLRNMWGQPPRTSILHTLTAESAVVWRLWTQGSYIYIQRFYNLSSGLIVGGTRKASPWTWWAI